MLVGIRGIKALDFHPGMVITVDLTRGTKVRGLSGHIKGVAGVVASVVEPTVFWQDGSPGDGFVRVTFEGIQFPNVKIPYCMISRDIEII